MSDPYNIELSEEAEEALDSFDKSVREGLIDKLKYLADNATAIKHKPLTGRWAGFYKYRWTKVTFG